MYYLPSTGFVRSVCVRFLLQKVATLSVRFVVLNSLIKTVQEILALSVPLLVLSRSAQDVDSKYVHYTLPPHSIDQSIHY